MRRLSKRKDTYTVEYPEAVAFAEKQTSIFWTAEEIAVHKDVQDILVNLTEAEKHGVITTLKLFTLYEQIVGEDYWEKVGQLFHHPADIKRMAVTNAFMEQGVHGPFYNKINAALGLSTDEFYSSYTADPALRSRIEMLERHARSDNIPEFLIALSFAEGVVLYSSFAFLKHFQSNGKNKISNIVRGINFSVRDESLHCDCSSWLYKTFLDEEGIKPEAYKELAETIAHTVREHEYAIVDKIFEKGRIEGITDVQMKHFIDSRINLVLRGLGYSNLYEVNYNPIASTFYDGINTYTYNDFFAGQGREYARTWDESGFTWD